MRGPRQWDCVAVAAKLRLASDDGQVLIEYALILALVVLVTIGALTALGGDVSGLLHRISSQMESVTNP
jgi:Flp pilus assembly pilin Flp